MKVSKLIFTMMFHSKILLAKDPQVEDSCWHLRVLN